MRGRILGIGWVDGDGPGKGRSEQTCNLRPGPLARIERADIFDKPDRRFGRLDDYSRLGLAAITLALQDARLDGWKEKRSWGIIASSRFGSLNTDVQYFDTVMPDGGALASPNLFAYTLSNCFTGEAAIRFGLSGQSYVITEAGPPGFTCLELALDNLETEKKSFVIAGISDLPVPVVGTHDVTPGAVFLVLSGTTFSSALRGAPISNKAGEIFIDEQPVETWNELVAAAQKKL